MQCLVFVRFFPGGRLAPEEFFARINAKWYSIEDEYYGPGPQSSKSAICIADYDSVEQLAVDLSIMPGAGISNVEVLSVAEEIAVPHAEFVDPTFSTNSLSN
jgi:hypothetical protein